MNDLGMVLSGGASRGSYQAGVLRFIYTDLAPRLGRDVWPAVVSGTSVGALNGVAVASHDPGALHLLSNIWQRMRIEDVVAPESASLLSTVRNLISPKAGSALLDPAPLQALLERDIPLDALRCAIDSRRCRAFIVSATELSTGNNVLFTDSADPNLDLQPLTGARVERVSMGAQHLLASASIPLVFPPVRLAGQLYVDGGLRQNTPLRPVLKAGARRVVLISPHVKAGTEATTPLDEVVPTLPFMAGKSMNALMSDPVERDLHSADQINQILAWGVARYGPEFAAGIERDLGLAAVSLLSLRPSADLGRMANANFASNPPRTTKQMSWLLHTLADQPNSDEGESDLLAYLYFDRGFTGTAEALGFSDARDQEERIANFLLETRTMATAQRAG
jgi:NTE family protein